MKVDFKSMQKSLESSLSSIKEIEEKAFDTDTSSYDIDLLEEDEIRELAKKILNLYSLLGTFAIVTE